MTNQNTVNDYAQKKFIELRHKLKLDVQKPLIQNALKLTQEHMDKMSDAQSAQVIFDSGTNDAREAARNVDNTFNFIDSLQLPPNLSLAIGLIISGHKTRNKEDIAKAVAALGEYTNGD